MACLRFCLTNFFFLFFWFSSSILTSASNVFSSWILFRFFFLSSPGSSRAKRTNYQHWQLSHIRSIPISFCSTDRRQRIASNRRTVSSQCPPAGILSLLLRFVHEASKDEKWNACLKAETGNAWKIAMFRVERREFFNLSDCHPEILCENSS